MKKFGHTDAPQMALALAIAFLTGEILAYTNPAEENGELHIISKDNAEKHAKVLSAMQVLNRLEGVDVDKVAQYHRWGEDILNAARQAVAGMGK